MKKQDPKPRPKVTTKNQDGSTRFQSVRVEGHTRNTFISALIEERKHTDPEILKKVLAKFKKVSMADISGVRWRINQTLSATKQIDRWLRMEDGTLIKKSSIQSKFKRSLRAKIHPEKDPLLLVAGIKVNHKPVSKVAKVAPVALIEKPKKKKSQKETAIESNEDPFLPL